MVRKLLIFGLLLISLFSLGCLSGASPNGSAPPVNTTQANSSNGATASPGGGPPNNASSPNALPTILENFGEIESVTIFQAIHSNSTNETNGVEWLLFSLSWLESHHYSGPAAEGEIVGRTGYFGCYKMNDSARSAMSYFISSLPAMVTQTQEVPCDDAWDTRSMEIYIPGEEGEFSFAITNAS